MPTNSPPQKRSDGEGPGERSAAPLHPPRSNSHSRCLCNPPTRIPTKNEFHPHPLSLSHPKTQNPNVFMPRILPLLILLLLTSPLPAQRDAVAIRFEPTFGGARLELDRAYQLPNGDSVVITQLRFYVSGMELLRGGKIVGACLPAYKLVDVADPPSLVLNNPSKKAHQADHIRFQLGIDSLTNVSGALAGDLDPTKGMYWAWQSGYINFKLEGNSPVCPARNHFFQFHLGGYLAPFLAVQTIELPLPQVRGEIVIQWAVEDWLRHIDLREPYEVMSPGENAVELARMASKGFKVVE